MKRVRVQLGKRSYSIQIAAGLIDQIPAILTKEKVRRVFLIANTRVFELHGKRLVEALEAAGMRPKEILIPDGEKYKNLHTVENIYTYLIAQRADRQSTILALGGGVTGDLAGFVAATFMRGVSYIQIPTTLLAQVDSSVGGKTGVNHPQGKNLIGVFHQPSHVFVDTDTLATLEDREYRAGVYEVIKYGLIYDATFFDYLDQNLAKILSRDPQVLAQVICRCCEIKAEVISIDEREEGLRRILNFGHTFGHALEAASAYQGILHGEAVGYGMLAAGQLSLECGLISKSEEQTMADVISRIGPLPSIEKITTEALLDAMDRDKKREQDRKVFVLLDGIGRTTTRSDISDEQVRAIWQRVAPPVKA